MSPMRWIVLLSLPTASLAADPTADILSEASKAPHADRAEDPALLVVKLHADWCPGCERIGDIDETLAAHLEGVKARFLTLDITDREARVRTAAKARALGIGEIYERNQGRVGVVLLVDRASGEVRETYTAQDGLERIRRGIREHAG